MDDFQNSLRTQLAQLLESASQISQLPAAALDPAQAVEAVALAQRIERQAGEHLEDTVAVARTRGASWQDIGTALGISRQAAYKRFGATEGTAQGAAGASSPIIDLIARTEAVFTHLSRDEFAAVRAMMTFTCARALTKKKVMRVWRDAVDQSGAFLSCSGTTMQTADGSTVLAQKLNQYLAGGLTGQTLLQHEAGEWVGRVAYTGTGKIAGLLIVHPAQAANMPF